MLKVTGGSGVGIMPGTDSSDAGNGGKQKPISRDELSMYNAPGPRSPPADAEPEGGHVEQGVTALRKLLEPYYNWCEDRYNTVKPRVQSVIQGGRDAYEFLQDPPKDFVPRVGIIGFTGVVGLLLARGSRVKRLLYPSAFMTVSTASYYPERAASIVRSTGDTVYERAVQGYLAVEKTLNPGSEDGKKDPGKK